MRTLILLLGVVLLAIGVAGFVPALTPDGVLFGVMPMDTLRSALFAITGVVGIMIGLGKRRDMTTGTPSDGSDLRPWM
jgi:hypothetical protein